MSRNEHFATGANEHQYSYEHDNGTVSAYHPTAKGLVGQMQLSDPNPQGQSEVRNVWVAPNHQRKGVATAMWNTMRKHNPNVVHSTTQSEAGKAWAAKAK